MNETWEIVCCIVCTAQHKEGREKEKGGIDLVLVFCLRFDCLFVWFWWFRRDEMMELLDINANS
jgi:hypothetical protein